MLYEKLYGFQRIALDFALDQPNAALFFEQGTGKTWVTVAYVEALLQRRQNLSFRALIVVPLTNLETTWVPLLSQVVKVTRSWKEFCNTPSPCVLLTHYESMPKLTKQITHQLWDLVVFDESQRLKARGTRQSRIAARIHNADRRMILSGTPIEQAPQDLWAQFRFVAPMVFGPRWADFDEQFLRPCGYMGYDRRFRDELMPLFLSMIEPHILRVKKDQVLDLPPLTYVDAPATMYGYQNQVYRQLERDMVAVLKSGEVSAGLKITQLVRLQQVCGGFVVDDDGNISRVGRAKVRRVRALVRACEKPVVVFCKYREEIAQVAEALAGDVGSIAIIDGKTRKTRTDVLSRFQRGEIDVLIAQVRTGGVGVDLFRSHNAIIYSTTFSFIDFEQAIARLHRHGQTHEVKVFLVYVEDSVDRGIFEAIIYKRKVSEFVLTRLRTVTHGPLTGGKIMAKKVKLTTTSDPATGAVTVKGKGKPAAEAPAETGMKYGVDDLAKLMELAPASVRIRLRAAKIAKAGKSYGWNTQKELEAIAKQIKPAKKDA